MLRESLKKLAEFASVALEEPVYPETFRCGLF
jgi:hypothetical protein